MKFLFIILITFLLNSCGNIMSASLIESFINPTTSIITIADYSLEKKTGKTSKEHAVSFLMSKDCKIDFKNLSICDENNNLINEEIITIQNKIKDTFKIVN